VVFHAGTRLAQDRIVTDGGRVLCVTALGENVRAARRRAYEALSEVQFAGLQFRNDIGQRAISRGFA
jgi:phosphoribosylamine--glycine ligase